MGCQGVPYREQGAAVGALSGAGLGAAIGRKSGSPVAGAVLGAAAGTLTGAAIGQAMDEQQQTDGGSWFPQRTAQPVSLNQIIEMTRAGLSEDVIIAHIEANGVGRRLSTNDLIRLKNEGVSDRVLLALQQPPRRKDTDRPTVIERHYVEPAPWWCWPPAPHPHGRHGFRWGITFYN